LPHHKYGSIPDYPTPVTFHIYFALVTLILPYESDVK